MEHGFVDGNIMEPFEECPSTEVEPTEEEIDEAVAEWEADH